MSKKKSCMRLIEAPAEDYLPYPHLFLEVERNKWIEFDMEGMRPTIKEAKRFIAKLHHQEEQSGEQMYRVTKRWIRKHLPNAQEVDFREDD